jgi:hypothetical protein
MTAHFIQILISSEVQIPRQEMHKTFWSGKDLKKTHAQTEEYSNGSSEIQCKDLDQIPLAQDMIQMQTLVKIILNTLHKRIHHD